MAPVGEGEAMKMLDGLKSARIFAPFRGRGALDKPAVARAISDLSKFAAANAAHVQSIDVNPLMVGTTDSPRGAVAADCVIVIKDSDGKDPHE